MICLQCNTRPICKVFDIMTTPGLEIDIKKCAYNSHQLSFDNVACVPTKETAASARPARDYSNISEQIKKASEKVVAASDSDEKKLKCTKCNNEFPESHLIVCSVCGKCFCETHSTIDMVTKKTYCESCWDDAPPAKNLPD